MLKTTLKFNLSFGFLWNKIASLLSEYVSVAICYPTSNQLHSALRPDLQVDEVLADDGLPLGGAGLVEGPRLLLGLGTVLGRIRAQD